MANVRVWLWAATLTAILLVSARGAADLVQRTHEYAYGCDSFGFLVQAKSLREAAADGRLPDFHIDAPQTRLLIDDLKSQGLRFRRWGELVAPHAHHYMRRSDHVGLQYPPGTGLALAAFPAGEAVSGLSLTSIGLLVLAGLIALLVAGLHRALASAGLVVLAIVLGFDLMVRHAASSYSILAIVPPLLLAAALAVLAASWRGSSEHRRAAIAAFGAGLCLGFAVLVRIPTVLLIPGYLLLLWPVPNGTVFRKLARVPPRQHGGETQRSRYAPLLALIGGLTLTGVAPLLLHQHLVAGAWHLTTYGNADASPPTAIDTSALLYYFGGGGGSGERWALLPALAGLLAAIVSTKGSRRQEAIAVAGLTWTRVLLAGAAIWLTSTVFFLTHRPMAPYYTAPGVFAAACVLAFGALAIEARAGRRAESKRWPAMAAAVALALVPVAAATARSARMERGAPPSTAAPPALELPAELADERAWVWADELTGTFWYYARKPAFKVAFSSEETRAVVYRFVHERGEPQFVVRDSAVMESVMQGIEAEGGVLEPRGEVAGAPYFSIHWRDAPAGKVDRVFYRGGPSRRRPR